MERKWGRGETTGGEWHRKREIGSNILRDIIKIIKILKKVEERHIKRGGRGTSEKKSKGYLSSRFPRFYNEKS